MGYKRYEGNTGRYRYMETPGETGLSAPPAAPSPPAPPPRPGPGRRPVGPELDREDWLVLAVLWLLYRSSGDRELLIALGAYLILWHRKTAQPSF